MKIQRQRDNGRYRFGETPYKEYNEIDSLRIGFKIVKRQPKTKSIHLENIDSVQKVYNRYYNRVEYNVFYHTSNGNKKVVTVKA